MYHLAHRATLAGFTLNYVSANCVTLTRGLWFTRTFRSESELLAFLNAADRGHKLNAANYVSAFDRLPQNEKYCAEQYAKGQDMGKRGAVVYISVRGSWSADVPSTTSTCGMAAVTAYEVLGRNAGTADLLRGWQDGGAVIVDYRMPNGCLSAA